MACATYDRGWQPGCRRGDQTTCRCATAPSWRRLRCSFGQVLRRDVVDEATLVEHQHALLHALEQVEVVAGDEHAGAALGQRGEQVEDLRGQGRIQVAD